MGVAPLAAWRYSSAKTLGRAMWKPFIASLVVLVIVLISGVRHWAALLGFWLSAFVAAVTLYEFWRGAMARRRRSGESFPVALWRLAGRNRRRYGGYIIHLGVVLMAIGIIGIELFQTETQGTIARGEQMQLGDYTATFTSLAVFDTADGRNVARAVMSVERNGNFVGELYPRRDYYYESQQPMTIPGVRSTWEDDFYILLVDWQPITSAGATFKIYHNPLVNWLWLGGFVFLLGTLVAAWPDRDPQKHEVAARSTSYAAAKA
jgi:cytochrome c-type biogenesis protein CcmF